MIFGSTLCSQLPCSWNLTLMCKFDEGHKKCRGNHVGWGEPHAIQWLVHVPLILTLKLIQLLTAFMLPRLLQ